MSWWITILALALLPVQERPAIWVHPPRLFDPTATGCSVAAIPAVDAELTLRVGDGPPSSPRLVSAGTLFQRELSGLPPGVATEVVVAARPLPGGVWTDAPPLRARTLAPPGQPVRLALLADTHAWALYTQHVGSTIFGGSEAWKTMRACLERVAHDPSLDFVVALTDTAMTQCGSGCEDVETEWGHATSQSVWSLNDALTRYRGTWSPVMLGMLAQAHPTIMLRGDHEGEIAYQDESIQQWSRRARQATLPARPSGWIHGPPGTDAFAFETGDLLLVALDVHSLTARTPLGPEGWHLGEAQHIWLADVLGASERTFKVVLAEHLVGGLSGSTAIWKARGGITATDDGTPDGVFLGEQAAVHAAMASMGVDLFIGAHDHVVAWGQKDGVSYLIAGRAGGVTHPWADEGWYRSAMDYDGDGVPEYETGTTGTREPGHLVLDVDGQRLRIEYRRASTDPALDGELLLGFELPARRPCPPASPGLG